MFESGWIKALTLPTRIVGGITLAGVSLIIADRYEVIQLSEISDNAKNITVIITILFVCLFIAALAAMLSDHLGFLRKRKIFELRRVARAAELENAEKNRQDRILDSLETLSYGEICHVAECIRNESPSFLASIDSGHVALLLGKELVYSPGYKHHRHHFPFSFYPFVWDEITRRQDEFLKRERVLREREDEQERGRRRIR